MMRVNMNFLGKGKVAFTDLILTDAGLNYDLQADCFSSEAGVTVTATSAPFHVHDYPETGLLRKTATGFKFTGPYQQVDKIIKAYNSGLIGMATCDGCPPGTLPKQKAFQAEELEEEIPMNRGTNQQNVEMDNWSPCDYPIFVGPGGSCTA